MNNTSYLQRLAIRLYAIVLIVAGVNSFAKTVFGLFDDQFFIDFAFLGIFIGKGLLDYKDCWRKWAIFVAWLGIISMSLGIALAFVWEVGSPKLEVGGIQTDVPTYIFLTVVSAALLFFLWQQRTLTNVAVKEAFSPEGKPSGWWLPIAITSLFLSAILLFHGAITRDMLRSIDQYRVTIHAIDAETNDPLSTDFSFPPRFANSYFPKSYACTTKDGGITISWVGIVPLDVEISANGYQAKKLTLGEDHKTSLVVPLTKIDPTK